MTSQTGSGDDSARRISPEEVEAATQRFRTASDKYGFYERFRTYSVEQLIERFNQDVGVTAWVSARAEFLFAIRDAFLATGLDCSSFLAGGVSTRDLIERRGDAIVQNRDIEPPNRSDTIMNVPLGDRDALERMLNDPTSELSKAVEQVRTGESCGFMIGNAE